MIRVAAPDEVSLILDWAAAEGWNPGLEDAAAFLAADPSGFFVALRDGRPVAAISVVNHSDDFAFLGLYICHPDWRAQGIGFALWKHALDHAGARTVGLDGVAAQQANYAKSGFSPAGSTARYEGPVDSSSDPEIRTAQTRDFRAIERLDLAANGFRRPAFLKAWLTPVETRRTVVLGQTEPVGFATIRRCREGVKIGPVVAPDARAGLRLIRAALTVLPSGNAIVDVPRVNTDLIALLEREGLRETFATARMYRGAKPRAGDNLQAIATMELG